MYNFRWYLFQFKKTFFSRVHNINEKYPNLVARAVTFGPKYHFFGYYGIQPWDSTGQYLLCLEVPFQNRPPNATDLATVGMVNLLEVKFIPLAETRAWNFQQGAMMHWLPTSCDSKIIFNDRQGKHFVSVILNVHTGERHILPRPISAVSPNGKSALSLNFARLHKTRPGYGYAGINDSSSIWPRPNEDGIYLIDLESGEYNLVVSMANVVDLQKDIKKHHILWFNHTLYNKNSMRFAFVARWRSFPFPSQLIRLWKWQEALFTVNIDGSDLRCVTKGLVSHFDWRNSNQILVWTNFGGIRRGFHLLNDGDNKFSIVGKGILTEDGHCSFSSNGKWILTDTYPDKNYYRILKIFNLKEEREIILGRFYSPPPFVGEIRCDLHPRWNRKDTKVCFDSVHEGTRQLYVMNISDII